MTNPLTDAARLTLGLLRAEWLDTDAAERPALMAKYRELARESAQHPWQAYRAMVREIDAAARPTVALRQHVPYGQHRGK